VGEYAGVDNGGGFNNGLGWGGFWEGRPMTADELRQQRATYRQLSGDVTQLRGQLRGVEGIDPAQLESVLRMLRQLDDERTYQNAGDLLRLQSAVAEQLKRFDYALRRKAAEENAVALSGSDEVPEAHKPLVEEYYRSLARAPR